MPENLTGGFPVELSGLVLFLNAPHESSSCPRGTHPDASAGNSVESKLALGGVGGGEGGVANIHI